MDLPTAKPIYLDYAATTPVDPRVVQQMVPFLYEQFGNPASRSHGYGWAAEEAVEIAREHVAALIARKGAPFIKVNCAALTESLLESELFGHEKGAFTGVSGERKGRFELALGGPLFLNEIGDISPAFQANALPAMPAVPARPEPVTVDAADDGVTRIGPTSHLPPSPSSAQASEPPEGDRERRIWAMEQCGWVQAKAARLLRVTPRQLGYALQKKRIEVRKS